MHASRVSEESSTSCRDKASTLGISLPPTIFLKSMRTDTLPWFLRRARLHVETKPVPWVYPSLPLSFKKYVYRHTSMVSKESSTSCRDKASTLGISPPSHYLLKSMYTDTLPWFLRRARLHVETKPVPWVYPSLPLSFKKYAYRHTSMVSKESSTSCRDKASTLGISLPPTIF